MARFAPWLVVVTVLLTVVFGGFATQTVQEDGFENFSPDNEVSAASEFISDNFTSGTDLLQLLVEGDGPLLTGDNVATAVGFRDTLTDDTAAGPLLADVPEGSPVTTFADPVVGAAAQQQLDPSDLSDTDVDMLVDQVGDEAAGQLLGQGNPASDVGLMVVVLNSETSGEDAAAAVQAVADTLDGMTVTAMDFSTLASDVTTQIEEDLGRLLILAFALIIAILAAIYRRMSDVLASLAGLVFTIVWMQGIGTLLGPAYLGWTGGMSEMSMAIPILLVGLGVDYSIHLTMRYREERAAGAAPQDAAVRAVGAVGVALALATITTAVGFLTNLANPLPPLQDFGVFAAVGVVSAFFIMVTFVPAVRLTLDRRRQRRGTLPLPRPSRSGSHVTWLGRTSGALARPVTRWPWHTLTAAAVLTVIGALSATNLSTEFSQTEFFPEGSEVDRVLTVLDEEFSGGVSEQTQVLIRGDVDQPGVAAAVRRFEETLGRSSLVRTDADGTAETDSVVTRITAAVNQPGRQEATQDTPGRGVDGFVQAATQVGFGTDTIDPDVTLPELINGLLTIDPSATAVTADQALLVTIGTTAGEDTDTLRNVIDMAATPLHNLRLDVIAVSEPIVVSDVMDELQASQMTGLVWTLVASMLILSAAFWFRSREPILGVFAITSVGIVVAWVFGLMAVFGIPFNVMTAMVSALAVGIGVPFGIHVVNRFIEDRDRHDTVETSMRSTLEHTGGALVGSAATTMAGFGVLTLSAVNPFRQFGLVLAMTIGLAMLSSVVVLPALLTIYQQARNRQLFHR